MKEDPLWKRRSNQLSHNQALETQVPLTTTIPNKEIGDSQKININGSSSTHATSPHRRIDLFSHKWELGGGETITTISIEGEPKERVSQNKQGLIISMNCESWII